MKESVDAALARITSPAPADRLLMDAMADSTLGATTLHRLLGTRPGRERPLEPPSPIHHAGWRLPARVILVDEASMIDLALMRQLAAAVADDAHLVLLGDAEQLPSVETGAVFRDLLTGAPAAAFRLTRSHRMNPDRPEGAAILSLAAAVNTGARVDLGPVSCAAAGALRFSGVEALPGDGLGRFLDRWHADILGAEQHLAAALDHRCRPDASGRWNDGPEGEWIGALLAAHARARILCLTRTAGRRTSAQAINRAMHARVQAAALGRGVSPFARHRRICAGEPVLLLANDHAAACSMAMSACAARSRRPRRNIWAWPLPGGGAIEVHRLDELAPHLAPAFALTVHKAQGSEYDRVALVLTRDRRCPCSRARSSTRR
jgi:exodeoxyribonuclease V alpha subunit